MKKEIIVGSVLFVITSTGAGLITGIPMIADAWASGKLENYLTIAAWEEDKGSIIAVLKAQEEREIKRKIRQLERIRNHRQLTEDEEDVLDGYKTDLLELRK